MNWLTPHSTKRVTPGTSGRPVPEPRPARPSGESYHPASPLLAGETAPSRRAFYRVIYPMQERPRLTMSGESFVVLDCSELGLRYEAPITHQPEVGSHCDGILRLKTGVDVPVSCEVVRHQERTVAVTFGQRGIPFGEIIAEQQYLRTNGYVLGDAE